MIKWLSISLFVLSIFLLFLLGFGVLLNDNEKQHQLYNRQLEDKKRQKLASNNENEKFVVTSIPITPSLRDEQKKSINLAIITKNLTCISNEQCAVVEIDFVDLTCTVAVNIIGETQLKKAIKDETIIGRCDNSIQDSKAICLDNFCSLTPSN
jgi:hypothetical protein